MNGAPKIVGFIDSSTKREGLPKVGSEQKCDRKDCPGPEGFERGFGLAGGGYGVYSFCETCGRVVAKTLVED